LNFSHPSGKAKIVLQKKIIFICVIAAKTLAACNSTGNKSTGTQNENNGVQASSQNENATAALKLT